MKYSVSKNTLIHINSLGEFEPGDCRHIKYIYNLNCMSDSEIITALISHNILSPLKVYSVIRFNTGSYIGFDIIHIGKPIFSIHKI